MNLNEILPLVMEDSLFKDPISPMHKRLHLLPDGDTKSNLALILGNNSSGKSLLRRKIQEVCNDHDVEMLELSMELRSQDPFVRAECYGDEEVMSTGMVSLSAMTRLLAQSREETKPHLLLWDEPDIGISEEAVAGISVDIIEFLKNPPEALIGFFLITHRLTMLEHLRKANPRALYLGRLVAPTSLHAWIHRAVIPHRPRDVIREGVDLWNAITEYEKKHEG